MAPEYGATCVIFPIDDETLHYLRFTGRTEEQVALVEAYAREQGMFHEPGAHEADLHGHAALDLGDVEPSLAGPRRPQDRVPLTDAQASFARGAEAPVDGRRRRAAANGRRRAVRTARAATRRSGSSSRVHRGAR